MNRPTLYSSASEVQRFDAAEVINDFDSHLQANVDYKESLLDVGTGSGDVLVEILIPALAQGFTRITGSDISSKMVAYSTKSHNSEGLDFKELNIETEQLPEEFHDQFDRVTSFYCLHWIRNQRLSLENIYKCLRKDGDCLLVFLGSNSLYNVYETLANDSKWKEPLKDVYNTFSPLFDHPTIRDEYDSLLKQAGFVDRNLVVKEKTFTYEGMDNFKYNIKAINPFPPSEEEFEEYFVSLCDCMAAMGLTEKNAYTGDYSFVVHYKLVVAYARKLESNK